MRSPVKAWRNQKRLIRLIGKSGEILSWTMIRVPPGEFTHEAPYPVVLVKLDDGLCISAQLVDYDPHQLAFGQRVTTVVRRVTQPDPSGVIPYGIKVKPVFSGDTENS